MPAKGQSCSNCAGYCCSIVSFTRVNGPPLESGVMNLTVKELKKLGYEEAYRPHKPCTAKTKTGCSIYDDRPKLCRILLPWKILETEESTLRIIYPLEGQRHTSHQATN